MEYHDKVLKCAECSEEFVFTAGEQMFFADKGFKNEPKRCKDCKAKRSQGPGQGNGTVQRVETKTTCSQCGKETTVPFSPRRAARCIAANAFSSGEPCRRPALRHSFPARSSVGKTERNRPIQRRMARDHASVRSEMASEPPRRQLERLRAVPGG